MEIRALFEKCSEMLRILGVVTVILTLFTIQVDSEESELYIDQQGNTITWHVEYDARTLGGVHVEDTSYTLVSCKNLCIGDPECGAIEFDISSTPDQGCWTHKIGYDDTLYDGGAVSNHYDIVRTPPTTAGGETTMTQAQQPTGSVVMTTIAGPAQLVNNTDAINSGGSPSDSTGAAVTSSSMAPVQGDTSVMISSSNVAQTSMTASPSQGQHDFNTNGEGDTTMPPGPGSSTTDRVMSTSVNAENTQSVTSGTITSGTNVMMTTSANAGHLINTGDTSDTSMTPEQGSSTTGSVMSISMNGGNTQGDTSATIPSGTGTMGSTFSTGTGGTMTTSAIVGPQKNTGEASSEAGSSIQQSTGSNFMTSSTMAPGQSITTGVSSNSQVTTSNSMSASPGGNNHGGIGETDTSMPPNQESATTGSIMSTGSLMSSVSILNDNTRMSSGDQVTVSPVTGSASAAQQDANTGPADTSMPSNQGSTTTGSIMSTGSLMSSVSTLNDNTRMSSGDQVTVSPVTGSASAAQYGVNTGPGETALTAGQGSSTTGPLMTTSMNAGNTQTVASATIPSGTNVMMTTSADARQQMNISDTNSNATSMSSVQGITTASMRPANVTQFNYVNGTDYNDVNGTDFTTFANSCRSYFSTERDLLSIAIAMTTAWLALIEKRL